MDTCEMSSYILDIPRFTAKNSQEHTKMFLERLGNPEKNRKIIHVAGTNGKGSTCNYVQAMLLAEQKTVGMFLSPHLERLNERIRIDGIPIEDSVLLESFESTKQIADDMMAARLPHPTFFEFLFGMAMYVFAKKNVEYVILETGLGGRLDATNAVSQPCLTIITSISMDHMEHLGSSIREIAGEKAGIIKAGIPVIFDANHKESAAIIRQCAEELRAPCREITNCAYEIQEITDKYIAFSTMNDYYEDTTWRLSTIARFQVDNAMLALTAMEYLFPGSCQEVRRERFRKALWKVNFEGRMEEVLPDVFIDGAHNQGAVERFVETVKQNPSYGRQKMVLLFSVMQDKDYRSMITYLCRELTADAYIVTEIPAERAADANVLYEIFQENTRDKILKAECLEDACHLAIQEKGENGRLYCLGSLYLAGMLKELVRRMRNA